ncbi:MAG: hypothetical protein ACXWC9_08580, partial [Pseudobdellovibrionaceae bacterium]
MKHLISTLMLSLLFVSFSSAHAESVQPFNDEAYRWLYEILIPEDIREIQPKETFKSFRVHLQDTDKVFPDPSVIRFQNLKQTERVQGMITYAGIVKKKYVYDVLKDASGALILNVRVHLKNATAADKIAFATKMANAQDFWNLHRPETDFAYSFQFDVVSESARAHYSVQVLDSTRGPYDQFWGRDWTDKTIAHELGHMLGLGDEYQTLSGVTDCYRPSLMCTSWTGTL